MSNKVTDIEEQYLLLEEEDEKEKKRKLIFLIILFLLIIVISIIGATFSYNNYKQNYKPAPACTINCDTDGDGKPDINIDYEGNEKAHFNVDTNGDLKPDFNLMNQDTNDDNKCDLNCDNNKDGWPDFNIDLDGDGIPDLNIKEGGNKLTNIDNNKDGICDVKCNGIIDEQPSESHENIILNMEYHDNQIIYIGSTKTYIAYDIRPGWKDIVEFKIVNDTPNNAFYQLRWTDIINTITETNNITYKLSKNNILVKDETKAPYDDTNILKEVMIPAKTTYTYKLMLEFKETGVDQTVDVNKEFSAILRAEITR